jgi:hypothetical protein
MPMVVTVGRISLNETRHGISFPWKIFYEFDVSWVFDKLLVCERDKVNAPKINELFLVHSVKGVVIGEKHVIAMAVYSMCYYNLPGFQQIVCQKIHKYSIKSALARTFGTGNQIDSIMKKIRKN